MAIFMVLPESFWLSATTSGINLRRDNGAVIPVLITTPEMLNRHVASFATDYFAPSKNFLLFEVAEDEDMYGTFSERNDDFDVMFLDQERFEAQDLTFKWAFDAVDNRMDNIRYFDEWSMEWEALNADFLEGRIPWNVDEFLDVKEWDEGNKHLFKNWVRDTASYIVKRFGNKKGLHYSYRYHRITEFLAQYLHNLESERLVVIGRNHIAAVETALYVALLELPYTRDIGLKGGLRYLFNYNEVVKLAHEIEEEWKNDTDEAQRLTADATKV